MDMVEAMGVRHSVRSYTDRRIEGEVRAKLESYIAQCNAASGLHIQLVCDEPKAFSGMLAHYGKFSGVRNYIALAGRKSAGLDEECGYWGEKVVLFAQTLGLNTCWAALTYSKGKVSCKLDDGEVLRLVIAIGYGVDGGKAHASKSREDVMKLTGAADQWFLDGVDAALLAPSAMNQQKFTFILEDGGKVRAQAGLGFYSRIDLGIAKCHFELGAGDGAFRWA